MSTKAHLFSSAKQAAAYKQFRPTYPQELFEAIYSYAGPRTDAVLDVATGSGQAAAELAKRYASVIAQDASEAQLAAAEPSGDRVRFMQATAEDTRLPDASVDLVTVAQALHWFDLPRFYAEAHRVLRPGGTLAAWGYDLCRLNDEDGDRVLRKLYDETLGPYWDDRRVLVEKHLEGMEPSEPGQFVDVRRWSGVAKAPMTISHLLGVISSWSAYHTFRRQHADKSDPLLAFHSELKEALELSGGSSLSYELEDADYPMFMILARKSE